MHGEIILIILNWMIFIFLWSMVIWGGWAEKTYEKMKDEDNSVWYYLKIFKIPRTRENCIKYLKFISSLGILILTIGSIFIVIMKL